MESPRHIRAATYRSASALLESVGRETAEEIWCTYPLLDYGMDWDPF